MANKVVYKHTQSYTHRKGGADGTELALPAPKYDADDSGNQNNNDHTDRYGNVYNRCARIGCLHDAQHGGHGVGGSGCRGG